MKKNEKHELVGAREKLPLWFGLAWSSRGVAAAINVILVGFITYYCTDILNLNAGIIGVMLLASKIIDGATDLFAGFIVDKTNTRWGKARPYELFIVFVWIFTIIIFNVPDMSTTAQYIFVFILYVLINAVCMTALGATDAVYMARAIRTEKNRISVMAINGVVVMFVAIVFNIIFPQIISTLGATKSGWLMISMYIGIPMALIGILRFAFIKELPEAHQRPALDEDHPHHHKNLKISTMVKLLLKNKYVFILVGMMLITSMANGLMVAATYYFKYMMGDIGLLSYASATGLVVPFVIIFFPLLSNKLGTSRLIRIFTFIGIIGITIRTIGTTNMSTIIIGSLFFGIASIPISMMINTYLIDCMDYGEWKTGHRIEGPLASVVNFSNKLGGALASGIIGFIMGQSGYDGALAVQTEAANLAIVGLYNYMPLFMLIIIFILSLFYKMDSIKPQMKKELEERK